MKIAILGTRGIPNYHGGFEQFAEYFAVYLYNKGNDVYVYNSSTHPYQESTFNGVKIIHCKDPENRIGTVGQFIYDFNCILDSRMREFDIILQLGYTSSSIWNKLLPMKSLIITNMDGLEWKRSKYSNPVKRFLKYAEKLAIRSSDYLISDSIGIQNYIRKTYRKPSEYIAYGAQQFNEPNIDILKGYNVQKGNFNMLIARLEPENNIESILDGVVLSGDTSPFLVIGKHDVNKFGAYLKNKFRASNNIRFIGGVYNIDHLNNLRYYSNLYFHGHSVGGTNPSLLEAMASNALIVAHDNEFNKSILKSNAFYFKSKEDISDCIVSIKKEDNSSKLDKCKDEIKNNFSWDFINGKYLEYLQQCYEPYS